MNVLVLTLVSIAALPDVANDNQLAKLCRIDRQAADGERVRLVIHVRDYHFVPRQAFAADLLDQDDALTAKRLPTPTLNTCNL